VFAQSRSLETTIVLSCEDELALDWESRGEDELVVCLQVQSVFEGREDHVVVFNRVDAIALF